MLARRPSRFAFTVGSPAMTRTWSKNSPIGPGERCGFGGEAAEIGCFADRHPAFFQGGVQCVLGGGVEQAGFIAGFSSGGNDPSDPMDGGHQFLALFGLEKVG